MGKELNTIWFVVSLVLGLYFINSAIAYYALPDLVIEFDKWIRLIGGILIILGGINFLRASKKPPKHPHK